MVKQGAQNDLILIVINPSKRNPSHSYVGCESYKCNMIFELQHITYILLTLRRLTCIQYVTYCMYNRSSF